MTTLTPSPAGILDPLRPAGPREFAPAVLFLARGAAGFGTGHTVQRAAQPER